MWESARHGSVAVGFRRFGADMAGIATRLWICLVGWLMLGILLPLAGGAAGPTTSSEGPPLDITAERIEYLQESEIYEADGSVVVKQGTLRLTADHMTIQALPGVLIATGHVRLTDPKADLVTERLELNVNTEAGVVTHGRVHLKSTNTSVEGRLLQRFSEDHYRVKEGRFTNCDAQKGETPAWRFEFKDLDLQAGDNVAFKGGWFCVNDVPVIPIPTMTYPLSRRHTGFLIPVVGWDSRFGIHVQESFLLGHQSQPGSDDLSLLLQQPRVWERFQISLYPGSVVEGAVVRQCLAADRVAGSVRREPDGTRGGGDSGV